MRAIITKALPATKTKPARIKASYGGLNITREHCTKYTSYYAHMQVMVELLAMLRDSVLAGVSFDGNWYAGELDDGYSFVKEMPVNLNRVSV